MNLKLFTAAAVAAVSFAAVSPALAQQNISSGGYTAGIDANGTVYNPNDGVGFRRDGDGYDPISPGTPRDSWGVSVIDVGTSYADPQFTGTTGLSTMSVFTASTASLSSNTSYGLQIDQDYSFVSGGNILKIVTSLTNTTGDAFGDVLFQRVVDWDIAPTQFAEQITGPHGAFGLVVDSTFNGFESPDPSAGPFGSSCFLGCSTDASDYGGGIRLDIGGLLAGATKSFVFYYGINEAGQSVADLITEGHAAGASYIIAGRSADGSTEPQNSAFIGVGAFNAVPEPATWAMMIMGFGFAGSMVRRRRAVTA